MELTDNENETLNRLLKQEIAIQSIQLQTIKDVDKGCHQDKIDKLNDLVDKINSMETYTVFTTKIKMRI